MLNPEAYKNK